MIALSYRDDMDCRCPAAHYLMAPQDSCCQVVCFLR